MDFKIKFPTFRKKTPTEQQIKQQQASVGQKKPETHEILERGNSPAAITKDSNDAKALNKLGIALKNQGQLEAAIESFRKAIAIDPSFAEAHYKLGTTLQAQGKLGAAIASFQNALLQQPDYADAHYNLGTLFQAQGKLESAAVSYRAALAINENDAEAYNNLGLVLATQGKLEAAVKNFRRAIALKPDYENAYTNLGVTLQAQHKLEEAVDCHKRLLSFAPNCAAAHHNLGNVLHQQHKMAAALECFQRALTINPDFSEALDMLVYTHEHCCDWEQYSENALKIHTSVEQGKGIHTPFNFLTISHSPSAQLRCAQTYAAYHHNLALPALWTGQIYKHKKIRIAYISADFRDHPVSHLIAGLIERHDRQRFEIIAIALHPEDHSTIGQRVARAFDQFLDFSELSDQDIALWLREREVDIAVDLMGLTLHRRSNIYAYRPAPIQVNYLGYPGTTGLEHIDYIIADRHVIPPEHQAYYTEKAVYLPDTYLVTDGLCDLSEDVPTRKGLGLPEDGFVFCCFNNSYKITPAIFDIWMRLLKAVTNSVLWLPQNNPVAMKNLQKEAAIRGIAPERLIFAERTATRDGHLARLNAADLFLDTLPYNAHTTTVDALCVGLPVLTCAGGTFSGRVAASLLYAVGLPELIAQDLTEYEALALKLATMPALLAEIRTKLANNRATYPLFDIDRFRRNIETAYITMWESQQRGEPPVSFALPELTFSAVTSTS